MTAFCKVSLNNRGGGRTGAHARYITREEACSRWSTRQVPEHHVMGLTDLERRRDVATWINEHAERGAGSRKDYRVVLSFAAGKDVCDERALDMAREFLRRSAFRDNPALMAVHRNTDHQHVHILVSARRQDGSKLHLDRHQYRSFDKIWARIYERSVAREERGRHEVRARAVAEWKRAYGRLRVRGMTPEQVKAVIGPDPRRYRGLSREAYHARRGEHEKMRLGEHLRGARATLDGVRGRTAAAGRGKHGPAERPGDLSRPSGRLVGGAAASRRVAPDREDTLERDVAGAVRAGGYGLDRSLRRMLRGRPVPLASRERESGTGPIRHDPNSGPRRVRDDLAGVRHRFAQRLGGVADRLTFREQVYPLLRRTEKHLDRLPREFAPVRERFQQLKSRIWQRFTGRTPGFRDELDLRRAGDPSIRTTRPLEFGRSRWRGR